ncbi:MAG: hypothetical protein WD068_00700 [Candidatus Babeliales bacterium]
MKKLLIVGALIIGIAIIALLQNRTGLMGQGCQIDDHCVSTEKCVGGLCS